MSGRALCGGHRKPAKSLDPAHQATDTSLHALYADVQARRRRHWRGRRCQDTWWEGVWLVEVGERREVHVGGKEMSLEAGVGLRCEGSVPQQNLYLQGSLGLLFCVPEPSSHPFRLESVERLLVMQFPPSREVVIKI